MGNVNIRFRELLGTLKAVPCEVQGGRLHLLLIPLFFTEPIIVPHISKLLANGDTSNIFLCVLWFTICCQQIKFMCCLTSMQSLCNGVMPSSKSKKPVSRTFILRKPGLVFMYFNFTGTKRLKDEKHLTLA